MQGLIIILRKFMVRFFCISAVFLSGIIFFISTAWGDYSFIYRDLKTGIYSNADDMISFRYMRHIWTGSDGAMAAVVQQGGYEGRGLALYKTLDNGLNWTAQVAISNDTRIASDGTIDSNNNILLVTSLVGDTNQIVDVNFIRLTYDPIHYSWSMGPAAQTTIFKSGKIFRATRATIAADSNGVLWCALRLVNSVRGIFQIRVYYSVDNGTTWTDSGNSFGVKNNLPEKSAKLISVGSRIAMIYHDTKVTDAMESYKVWAYRKDFQALDDGWTSQSIAKMTSADGDPYGSHWSVAADYLGNIHLSYEDSGIRYIEFNAASNSWGAPMKMTREDWHYSNISVAPNNDIYLLARNSDGTKIMATTYSSSNQVWSDWVAISSKSYSGYLRMSSPERFIDYMPVLYQVMRYPPFELIYDLFR